MPHSADLYTRKLSNKPIPHLIYKKVCGHQFISGIVLQIHQYLMQVGSGFVEHLGTQFNLFFDHMLYVRGFFFSLLLNKRMHCSPLYSFSNNALKVTYLSVSLYKNVFQRFLGYYTLREMTSMWVNLSIDYRCRHNAQSTCDTSVIFPQHYDSYYLKNVISSITAGKTSPAVNVEKERKRKTRQRLEIIKSGW